MTSFFQVDETRGPIPAIGAQLSRNPTTSSVPAFRFLNKSTALWHAMSGARRILVPEKTTWEGCDEHLA